jgi:hypothetical protein
MQIPEEPVQPGPPDIGPNGEPVMRGQARVLAHPTEPFVQLIAGEPPVVLQFELREAAVINRQIHQAIAAVNKR